MFRFAGISTVWLVSMALAWSASAGQLSLTGQNLVWSPTIEASPTHVVGIENLVATTDPLFSWSLGLVIVPDAGAIGTVEFASATLPIDYLLAGRSGGLSPPFVGPTDTIAPIGDSDSLFTGIVVPATGENLLATTFQASPNALGTFYITAIPDPFTGANWFSSDFVNARDFANVPFAGGGVVIGSIQVVPEPSTMALAGMGVVLLVGMAARRRRRFARP